MTTSRQKQGGPVDPLQRMLQSGAVALGEDVTPHLDHVRGSDAYDKSVERSMVDCAHGDPVRHDGLTTIRVLLDMRRIEKFGMTQTAECALSTVRGENTPPEVRLMESPTNHTQRVLATTDFIRSGEVDLALPSTLQTLV